MSTVTTKRIPIREGDQFKARNGVVWQVTEVGKFGSPHWVINIPERTRQTIFQRHVLEEMERITQ